MIMYRLITLALFSILGTSSLCQSARVKYNFNSNWRVLVGDPSNAQSPLFDDSAWKPVTTPYAWNENDAFRVDIANLSTGVAWYRKRFKLPDAVENKKVFVEFEGIRHGGEFFLNGKSIGLSENGVMAFGFDLSADILSGKENILAARIDNSWDYREKATNQKYQWSDMNFYANYGGINKNVFLHVADKLYQTLPLYSNMKTIGVYVYAKDIHVSMKSATIVAETQVKNDYNTSKTFTYGVRILETSGVTKQIFNGSSYTLKANETKIISTSSVVTNLDFWSWGYGALYDIVTSIIVDGNEVDTITTRTGFRKTDFQKGIFKLNDRALHLKGYAQRTTNEWVALGSAVPAWLSDFSNKLVLESNGNLIRWMHVTPWKQDIESLDRLGILQSMPAGDSEGDVTGRRWEQRVELMRDAIIYNRNNPSIVFYEGGNKGITEAHQQQLKTLRDTYDPHGGRATGAREMLDSKVAEFGGEMLYINKGARIPFWAMEYSRDEGLRKYWDEFSPPYHVDGDGPKYKDEDAREYNRNQDSHAVENVNRWFDYYEQRPGTGERVNAGGVNIIFSDSNTHHRGAENYRRSGEVDAVRLPKDGWYAHKVMWDNWVDLEKSATHIIGHWNYAAGTTKNIYVVSTAEKVELAVNGKVLGIGIQSKRFLFTFPNVTYAAGDLVATGYTGSSKTSSDSRSTSGEAISIRLTTHVSPVGFRADGNDIALVDVEVVDANGKRNPIALNTINFTLSGQATWRGGIAQGPDNYILSTILPVENGVNRVLLRSTTKAGTITLQASSIGLKSASVTLISQSFNSTDGLSIIMPSDGLPFDMSRGATPAGASFKPSRKPLTISSVTAGSNIGNATSSFDDNEVTSWTSSGNSDIAWIKYTIERPTIVSQVVVKLGGWRTKTYPLRISVDDNVVWKGTTTTSLGYVTLNFNQTTGSSVQVTLDKGSMIVEIVEVELYGPV